MQSDDVKEILARLEPTLAHIDSELARQSDELTRLSGELARQSSEFTRQSNMLSRIDERTKLAPTHGGVIGLIPETNAGIIAAGALLAHFIH